MTDPQTIVEGMTRAQRWALEAAEPILESWYPTCRSRAVEGALIRKGLVDAQFGRLTADGLAVRTHLEKESKK